MKITKKETIGIKGVWDIVIQRADGSVRQRIHKENLTPDVFLNAIMIQLFDDQTYNIGGDVFYIAVGDNGATPVPADTQLGNELERRLVGVKSYIGAVGTFTVFYNAGELLGNYREVGLFTNGSTYEVTSAADTGLMGSRIQEDFTVGTGETVTITFNFTFRRPL
jgi:hypothetical protein